MTRTHAFTAAIALLVAGSLACSTASRFFGTDSGGTVSGTGQEMATEEVSTLEPGVDFAFHQDMPTPAIYHLQHDGVGWRVMGGHGFREVAAGN